MWMLADQADAAVSDTIADANLIDLIVIASL